MTVNSIHLTVALKPVRGVSFFNSVTFSIKSNQKIVLYDCSIDTRDRLRKKNR